VTTVKAIVVPIPAATADRMNSTGALGENHTGRAVSTPYVAPSEDWCSRERAMPNSAATGMIRCRRWARPSRKRLLRSGVLSITIGSTSITSTAV